MTPSLNNLSLNDCCKIMKKKLKTSDFDVNSFKICPLSEPKGFLGDYYYLLINYAYKNKEETERFFVKKKSTAGPQQDFLEENKMFLKECLFYGEFGSDVLDNNINILSECIPECYLISEDEYIVFENLEIQGYVNLNHKLCSRLDYVKCNLDTLSRLHCASIILEEKLKEKDGRDLKLSQRYPEVFAESFFPRTKISKRFIDAGKEGADAIIDLGSQIITVDTFKFKKIKDEIYDTIYDIVKPSTIYRNTMCHCDLWATNIMCKFKDDIAVHSRLVDFQMFRYGPPAQDFMAYLYLTTNRKFRQDHLRYLIEYYYKKSSEILEEYGLCPAKIISYEEFVESCNYYKVYACLLAVNHHQMTMFAEEIQAELLETGYMQKMLFEGRPEIINKYWNKDEFYRKKMIENITELADILMENKLL